MKKIIAIIMTICLLVSVLAACSHKKTTNEISKTDPTTEATTTPTEVPTDAKEEKYQKAYEMLEQKNYEAAYALFAELGDYKNAAKEVTYFRYMPSAHYVEYTSEEDDGTITYTITLNDQNLPATVVEEYNTGLKHTCALTYNEFGYVTRRECTDTEGETTLYEATYDAKGNRLSETYTDSEGNVTRNDYTYNEKDQLIKDVSTDASASDYYSTYTATFEYDAEGREIKSIAKYENETIIQEFTYDAEGKILKQTWAEDGVGVYSIYDYYYDEKGRPVEILFTEEGEDGGFRRVTFNDKDQMLTEHVYYAFGFEYTYNYEYDEHGNVIKATYTNPDVTVGNDITESTYKFVYIPFDYTVQEWLDICDSTKCWDLTHW